MSIYDLPGDTPGQVGPGRAATALYLSLAVSIALALALALVLSLGWWSGVFLSQWEKWLKLFKTTV